VTKNELLNEKSYTSYFGLTPFKDLSSNASREIIVILES